MTEHNILILDDERDITDLLENALHEDGFEAAVVRSIADFESAVRTRRFDLHIVDLGLPDGNGLDLIQKLGAQPDTGVIILSGRGSETDRVVGLRMGADDYVTKPFHVRELVARVHAVLRRITAAGHAPDGDESHEGRGSVGFDGYTLDLDAREAFDPDGRALGLTSAEFQLLEALVSRWGEVLHRDDLTRAVKGRDWDAGDRTVDGLVSRLRHKIPGPGEQTHYIRTVHGVGYAFSVPHRRTATG